MFCPEVVSLVIVKLKYKYKLVEKNNCESFEIELVFD